MGEWWMMMARVWILGERVVMLTVVGADAETEAKRELRGEVARWLMPLGIVPLATVEGLGGPLTS